MSERYGRHEAGEVLKSARKFLDNATTPSVWEPLSDKLRGRMTKADLKEGEKRYQAANQAFAASGQSAAQTQGFVVDHAETAAVEWLHDQTVHVRRRAHDAADTATLDALDRAFTPGKSRSAIEGNIRAYVELAKGKDAVAKVITASYADTHSRDAILKDGLHLADALEGTAGEVAASQGTREAATQAKDQAVDQLARWLHGWVLVAHRVVPPAGLTLLGLGSARHHPAHRKQHPATTPPATPSAAR